MKCERCAVLPPLPVLRERVGGRVFFSSAEEPSPYPLPEYRERVPERRHFQNSLGEREPEQQATVRPRIWVREESGASLSLVPGMNPCTIRNRHSPACYQMEACTPLCNWPRRFTGPA